MKGDTIKKIDQAIEILRNMKSDYRKLEKLSAINSFDLTPKQAQKRRYDADWIGMANIKRRHELHALAVELDFSDRRKEYGPIELTDGWHRYSYKPREPNAIEESR